MYKFYHSYIYESPILPITTHWITQGGHLKKDAIIKNALDPQRVSRYWNTIFMEVLELPDYAISRCVKIENGSLILETPFIEGDEFDNKNPFHKKAIENLYNALERHDFMISDMNSIGNVKLIKTKDDLLLAVPIDMDFVFKYGKRDSYLSNGFTSMVDEQQSKEN